MNSQNAKIDICVATYRRPGLLSKLLESLEQQELGPALECQIVVIDNDATGTAREIVEKFAASSRFHIEYDIEPVRNIALARNRALKHTTGDFVVFIDDDEIADPDWIQNLYNACEKFQSGAVFGPVLPDYPPATPDWIIKGRFFERRRYRSGTTRHEGGTGNTFIRCSALKVVNFRFDPSFGLTGGEDSELFYRVFAARIKMIWCDEAIVHEPVPYERMTVQWLVLRAFRIGQTLALVRIITLSRPVRIYQFLRRVSLLPIFILGLIVSLPFGRPRWVKVLQKVSGSLGYISTITKYRYREYQ